MTATRVDAVVIGAGQNGLVAGNLLADAGWDVLVLEAQDEPGGAVRSAEVTAPGYVTDLFSAFYPLGAASPVMQRLELGRHGLAWSHAPAVLAHVLPDDSSAVLSRDVSSSAASVARFAGGDGTAWTDLFEEWQRISEPLRQALFRPFPPLRPAVALLRELRAGPTLRLARRAMLPVRRFAEEEFDGRGAPMLFAGNALHADLGPDAAGSAIYGWLLTMLAQEFGFPVPVGGSGQLTRALVRRLAAAGGQVRTGARVTAVTVAGGRATGVRLADGTSVTATRAVLADVDAPALFTQLLDPGHLPAGMLDDLSRFEWDTATLKLNWALDAPIPWTASDAAGAGTVHLGVDLDGLTDYAADLSTRRMPRQPFVLVGQMTTSDPTRSPAGTESVWAYTHIPRAVALDGEALQRQVEAVERLMERHAPGFAGHVVGRHVQLPDSLQDADSNLVGGAINGGTAQIHQQLFFRPVPGLSGAATPVDGLFLAGASAHPGGGVHGACGSNAAAAALARAGLLGGLRRAATKKLLQAVYA